MPHGHPQIGPNHRRIGAIALLVVVVALIGNVAALAWLRPYSILTDLGPIAEAREQINTRFVGEVDDQALIDAALKGMADALGDKNTEYLSRDDVARFNEHMNGKFPGIGAVVDSHEDLVRVVSPMDDSPAMRAGLLPGDLILSVNGKQTLGVDLNTAVSWLRGPSGTHVTIRVRHPDGKEQDLTITRAEIEVPTVVGFRRNPGNGYHYMLDPGRKIAYVKLTTFGEDSATDITARLNALKQQGMQALIFDLRDNGGGLLTAAVDIADLFLTEGKTIVTTEGKSEGSMISVSTAQTLLPDTPVVVLVNEYSASASEIVAGALRDNKRALIVGTRSYGKGSVQQLIYLTPDQSTALKLTTAYWYLPSGRLIHKKDGAKEWGVDPSPGCYVPMDAEQVRAMMLKQHESQTDSPFDKLDGPITPAWLKQTMLDDQLAAALAATQGRLDGGVWPKVGIDLEQALAEPTEREQLETRRDELHELIEQVESQLDELKKQQDAEQPEPILQP